MKMKIPLMKKIKVNLQKIIIINLKAKENQIWKRFLKKMIQNNKS